MSDLDRLDYYTLLGVKDDATVEEVKRAFKKFARKYHPDRFAGASADKIEKANAIYRRGSEAYQVLIDPPARQAYDGVLGKGILRLDPEVRDKATAPRAEAPAARRPPIASTHALALYKRAVVLAKQDDWRGAWKLVKQAIAEEPHNDFLRQSLAKIERRLR